MAGARNSLMNFMIGRWQGFTACVANPNMLVSQDFDAQAGKRVQPLPAVCILVPTISHLLMNEAGMHCGQSLLSMLNNVQWLTKWPKD